MFRVHSQSWSPLRLRAAAGGPGSESMHQLRTSQVAFCALQANISRSRQVRFLQQWGFLSAAEGPGETLGSCEGENPGF